MENMENIQSAAIVRRENATLTHTAATFGDITAGNAAGFTLFAIPALQPIAQAFTNAAVGYNEVVKDNAGNDVTVSVTERFQLLNKIGTRETVVITNPEIQKWVRTFEAANVASNIAARMKCVALSRLSTVESLKALGFSSVSEMAFSMFGLKKEYSNILARIGETFFNDDFSVKSPLFDGFTVSHLQELYRLEAAKAGLSKQLLEEKKLPLNSSVAELRKAVTAYLNENGLASGKTGRQKKLNAAPQETENAAQPENSAQPENAAQNASKSTYEDNAENAAPQEAETPRRKSRNENILALLAALGKSKDAANALFTEGQAARFAEIMDAGIALIQGIVAEDENNPV